MRRKCFSMKATKKILGSFLSFILIMTMLPVSSMRVYADNNIPENTISLQPTSVELSPSAVHSQIPFTVSAEKTENVEDIQIFFQEGTLTDGSYTIPFKVNKDPEASEGNRWASFTFRSASYSNTMAVIVNSASLSSANAGVYMGYLQWNAGFWTHESEKIKDINGQILMTLKIGYDITVSSNAYGRVSSSCSMARAGETVTLDVVANQGYQFKEWQIVSGNVTIENNQFTMPEGDVEICAVFDKLCEVNFEANGGSGTMDSDTFFASEGYTLPSCGFTAPGGYTFKDWTVTWENEGASNSTNKMAGSILTGITEDIMVSANWMDLSLKVSPSGAGSVVYENGAFTATANAGYTFDHWEYADDEYSTAPIGTVWPTDNPYQPAEVDHKIYTAVFKANTYNLTLHSNNDERGTVTYSGTPKTGNKITLTATAYEGYIFKEWQIEPTGIVIDANNKFKMPASNVTVTAVFDHLQTVTYSMTVNKGTGMTKTEDSGAASQTGLTGAMTTVVYTADDGYYFPTDYSVSSVNGISVTRNSYNQIIVSGTPTADTTITLLAATAKTTPNAPTTPVADNCTTSANNDGKISGVTTAMEYKKSDDSGWTAVTETEIMGLTPGTYYIRLKATDTTFASANKELTITAYTAPGQVAAPTFSPAGGIYTESQNVTISCGTLGADIYYTTNGTVPTSSSTKYTGAIYVTSTTTIKAIAINAGMTNSAVATATYTINDAPAQTTYTITFNPNGGTVSPTSKVTGNNGILASLPTPSRSGYNFNGWFTLASGGTKVTISTVFTSNDMVYAHWERVSSNPSNKTNPAPVYTNDRTDNTSSDTTNDEGVEDYFDELRTDLSAAVKRGGKQTVFWNKGTSLPYDIMRTLQDNSNLTLNFKYKYMGISYDVTIPGRAVKTNVNVKWYGPINLYGTYRRYSATTSNPTIEQTKQQISGTYTVKKGDSLSGIARRFNTSVQHLVDVNNIPDKNRIRAGQVIRY